MARISALSILTWLMTIAHGLSLRTNQDFVFKDEVYSSINNDCDPSMIPVMKDFDMKKFAGAWYELAKSASGFIDVDDGMWKISSDNSSNIFLFSGRDNNGHCIRPIRGKIFPETQPPGLLNLHYQTYSTHVEETIRVLFTDYSTIAVIYTCMFHVHHQVEVCHAAGILGSIWTRRPHVDLEVYEKALQYLERACVHKSILTVRNLVGPCIVDDLGFRIDDFPAPDFCYQHVDLGSCRGSLQRYYYDPKEKICKLFLYGGCGGNRNNFMSLPECQAKCVSASSKEPICMSVAKCGIHCSPCCTEDRNGCVQCNCEHIIEDNFLNCQKSASNCEPDCGVEEFYPGCFICRCSEETKVQNDPAVCLEVKKTGGCDENMKRFYYDAIAGQCEEFVYTGCNGNNNNFQSLQECNEICRISDNDAESTDTVQYSENSSIKVSSSNIILLTMIIWAISHRI